MGLPHFEACIFDMDGLLLDTEQLAVSGWIEAAHEMGFSVAEEVAIATVGLDRRQTFALLRDHYGQDFPAAEIRELRNQIVQKRIDSSGVPLKAGAHQMLNLLKARAVLCAVATSTQRARAIELLTCTDILRQLDALVCTDEVDHPKPAPDIYLETARRLSVLPGRCIVFEDSAPGITAAHRAGMVPILIPDIGTVPAATRTLALAVCESLTDAIPLANEALG